MYQNNVEDFMKIREVNVMRLKEMKEKGQKVVGFYCTFCPTELIIAAGAIPVGLCGTKEDPIPAAEEVLPRNLCPLIKSSYGFAATGTCPFFHFSDLIVGETTCDGKKKMFEIMQDIKEVHVMELPNLNKSGPAFDLWVDEIRKFRTKLEEKFQIKITDEAIREAITLVNEETKGVKKIADLNKMDPPPLSGIDLLTTIWSRGFNTDRKEIIGMLSELEENIKDSTQVSGEGENKGEGKRESEGEGKGKGKGKDKKKTRPRVLLTGTPVGLGSEKVIRLAEEKGGAVVAMENCTVYKTLEMQTDENCDDPIIALARKYINIPCSCMSPNPDRIELLERMIEEFQADAVIDLTWQACHTYNIESFAVEKLARKLEVPYLHLESDYSNSDAESLSVRIEALLEMVAGK